ncbi:MAG: hypothetical protein ACLP5H_08990 [Desulfomonilaceae bacterium]
MRYRKGFVGFVFALEAALLLAWPAADTWAQAAKEVVTEISGPLSGVAVGYGQDCADGRKWRLRESMLPEV